MATKPTLAERERALLEAARREIASKPPATAIPGAPSAASAPPGVDTAPGNAESQGVAPQAVIPQVVTAAETPPAPGASPTLSIEQRIAALMAAEQAQKARRSQNLRRWKIAGIAVLAALALWWAVTVLRFMHH
jgi:hypothetical protein